MPPEGDGGTQVAATDVSADAAAGNIAIETVSPTRIAEIRSPAERAGAIAPIFLQGEKRVVLLDARRGRQGEKGGNRDEGDKELNLHDLNYK